MIMDFVYVDVYVDVDVDVDVDDNRSHVESRPCHL